MCRHKQKVSVLTEALGRLAALAALAETFQGLAPLAGMSQSKHWLFTIHDETTPLEDKAFGLFNWAGELEKIGVQYFVIGEEIGPENGKRHFQGFVQLCRKKRMSEVKKMFDEQSVHIGDEHGDFCRNPEAAIKYCKKDGKWIEHGNYIDGRKRSAAAGDDERNRWESARKLAKQGKFEELVEQDPRMVIHLGAFEKYSESVAFHDYSAKPRDELENFWFWGPAGSGKTRRVFDTEGSKLYEFEEINRFSFDGYNPRVHEAVLFDDLRASDVEKHLKFLKRVTDHYPFKKEIKGGRKFDIRPQRVYFTSLLPMSEVIPKEHLSEFKRRFKEVEFKSLCRTSPG